MKVLRTFKCHEVWIRKAELLCPNHPSIHPEKKVGNQDQRTGKRDGGGEGRRGRKSTVTNAAIMEQVVYT